MEVMKLFDKDFINHFKSTVIFIIIYTLVFILFFSTLSYTLPFVIALIIAMFTKPINRFLIKKLKFNVSIASLLSTILVFAIITLLLTSLIFKFTTESRQLIANLPNINIIINYLQSSFNRLQILYNKIDPSIILKLQEQIGTLISSTANITANVLGKLISFAIALPMVLLIIFITLLATYFFSKDMTDMQTKVISIFSPEGTKKVRMVYAESYKMLFNYVKAYSFVIFMTFLETLIGFSILNVKYALILSIICAIFDVLPILGIGAIYLPLAIVYFISKQYFIGFALIVLYLLVIIIRQIIEPKLVSSSLGLHPVAVLAAIFIGIKVYGFIGMIYFIFIMVFYNVLKKVKVL